MSLLEYVLEPPTYGFTRDGKFYKPTHREIFREFFKRTNVFADRKNWLSFLSWVAAFSLAVPFFIFLFKYFTVPRLLLGLAYSMILMGTCGTIYLHRYSTHRAFVFKGPVWRFFVRNLTFKIIPEEIYVLSHHVHHHMSEQAGDPYNVHGGWLYCFLADVNHQTIARNLSEKEYQMATKLMAHTGVKMNTYEQYQKWGSIAHPLRTTLHYVLNWAFWFGFFYLIGGAPIAFAITGVAVIWAFGIRTYNYDGHGGGKDKRRAGIDFNRDDLSINRVWPGYVAGEWHNNHHLYPNGARSGFQPYQLDLAWIFVWSYHKLGGIASYRDYKADFLRDYYLPYRRQLAAARTPEVRETAEVGNPTTQLT